jgi:putative endonuclease
VKGRKQALGQWGEEAAADYLIQHGMVVIDRNIRTPYGEIDLLARQGEDLIFVEVKTRTTQSYGPPETAITSGKRRHMIDSASHYIQEHPEYGTSWRLDVAAVTKNLAGEVEILYFENAVGEDAA